MISYDIFREVISYTNTLSKQSIHRRKRKKFTYPPLFPTGHGLFPWSVAQYGDLAVSKASFALKATGKTQDRMHKVNIEFDTIVLCPYGLGATPVVNPTPVVKPLAGSGGSDSRWQ